jgi:hypothetical protein
MVKVPELFEGLEIDHSQVGAALLQCVGDHAAVAAGGVGLEAQERRGGRVVEFPGEVVERVRRVLLDVGAHERLQRPARRG